MCLPLVHLHPNAHTGRVGRAAQATPVTWKHHRTSSEQPGGARTAMAANLFSSDAVSQVREFGIVSINICEVFEFGRAAQAPFLSFKAGKLKVTTTPGSAKVALSADPRKGQIVLIKVCSCNVFEIMAPVASPWRHRAETTSCTSSGRTAPGTTQSSTCVRPLFYDTYIRCTQICRPRRTSKSRPTAPRLQRCVELRRVSQRPG